MLERKESTDDRRHDLDAVRAFALLLGVVFHASLSFVPIYMGWAVQDVSTSPLVTVFVTVSHSFRMETFFLVAGVLSHRSFHRKGAKAFVRSRVMRIGIPFVAGWFLIRPLMVSGWIMGSASLRGPVDPWVAIAGGFASLSTLPSGVLTGTHLWFLYYLVLVTALLLVVRAGVVSWAFPRAALVRATDTAVAWLARSPFAPLAMAMPAAGAILFMRSWGVDTPDRSLVPDLPVLGLYGGYFALGWLLGRQPQAMREFARLGLSRWIPAILGIGAMLLLGPIERDPGHSWYAIARVLHAGSHALAMSSLVLLTLGLFQKGCTRPRAWVRFMADASYWMYLIHLPIVVWLQVAVAELPWHWSVKLASISATTVAIALASYGLFVCRSNKTQPTRRM